MVLIHSARYVFELIHLIQLSIFVFSPFNSAHFFDLLQVFEHIALQGRAGSSMAARRLLFLQFFLKNDDLKVLSALLKLGN